MSVESFEKYFNSCLWKKERKKKHLTLSNHPKKFHVRARLLCWRRVNFNLSAIFCFKQYKVNALYLVGSSKTYAFFFLVLLITDTGKKEKIYCVLHDGKTGFTTDKIIVIIHYYVVEYNIMCTVTCSGMTSQIYDTRGRSLVLSD